MVVCRANAASQSGRTRETSGNRLLLQTRDDMQHSDGLNRPHFLCVETSVPVKSTIDPNTGVIVHRATEQLSMPDLLNALDRIGKHPLYQPGANALWNLSDVTLANAESRDLRELAGKVRQIIEGRGTGYKVAIVAPRDVDYGVARMYEAYASELPVDLRVLRNSEDAWEWLTGRSEPDLPQQD